VLTRDWSRHRRRLTVVSANLIYLASSSCPFHNIPDQWRIRYLVKGC